MNDDYSLGPFGCLWLVGLALGLAVIAGAIIGLVIGSASLVAGWVGG